MKKNVFLLSFVIWFLTGYGQQKGTFTDSRDGKVYKTVKIGTQTWMAENLNYNTPDSWCNQCSIYGRLYTYDAALIACPSGWHLPSDAEWTALTDYLDGESVAGSKLKSKRGWQDVSFSGNITATNSSGFTALSGGKREIDGSFGEMGRNGFWWSSTEYNTSNAWYRNMYYNTCNVFRRYSNKTNGFSVRCVKDQ